MLRAHSIPLSASATGDEPVEHARLREPAPAARAARRPRGLPRAAQDRRGAVGVRHAAGDGAHAGDDRLARRDQPHPAHHARERQAGDPGVQRRPRQHRQHVLRPPAHAARRVQHARHRRAGHARAHAVLRQGRHPGRHHGLVRGPLRGDQV